MVGKYIVGKYMVGKYIVGKYIVGKYLVGKYIVGIYMVGKLNCLVDYQVPRLGTRLRMLHFAFLISPYR